jgi:cytochrome c2
LFGRTSGTTAGYTYSAANKNKAVVWSEEHIYEYLLNPKKVWQKNSLDFCAITVKESSKRDTTMHDVASGGR